jgi:hypothetical protein
MNGMIHRIKKIHSAVPYKLTLEFNTGEIKELDMERKIRERSASAKSLYKQLLHPEYFKSVKLDSECEFVYWDNGLDFCPDAMYMSAVEQEEQRKEKEIASAQ